jgi:hypothetical protein
MERFDITVTENVDPAIRAPILLVIPLVSSNWKGKVHILRYYISIYLDALRKSMKILTKEIFLDVILIFSFRNTKRITNHHTDGYRVIQNFLNLRFEQPPLFPSLSDNNFLHSKAWSHSEGWINPRSFCSRGSAIKVA